MKKMCQHPLWEEDYEAGLYGRIVDKNPLLRKQINIKRLWRVKAHKDWTKSSGIKSFGLTNQSFEILGLIGESMCG